MKVYNGYLVIAVTQDGPRVDWLDKDTLEDWLNKETWGNIKWLTPPGDNSGGILNVMEDGGYGLIIKGEIVEPKEKTVVVKYSVE